MLPSEPDPNIPPNYHRPTPRRGPNVSNKAVAVIAVIALLIAVAWSVFQMNTDKDESSDWSRDYEWRVPVKGISNIKFTVSVTIPGEELDLAKSSTIDRTGSSTSISDHANGVYAVSDYVVVSDTIKKLAGDLWAEYKSEMKNEWAAPYDSPQMFANYVLTFVQAAVDYKTDDVQFDKSEYWLYPIETLHYGYGDCEDTSILAAAIYSALAEMDETSAYVKDSCVFLLPGHAMVGVDVIGGVPAPSDRVILGTSDYYFGETTIDDIRKSWMGVGQISEGYMSSSVLGFTGHITDYVR
jgi:hypothetical protein